MGWQKAKKNQVDKNHKWVSSHVTPHVIMLGMIGARIFCAWHGAALYCCFGHARNNTDVFRDGAVEDLTLLGCGWKSTNHEEFSFFFSHDLFFLRFFYLVVYFSWLERSWYKNVMHVLYLWFLWKKFFNNDILTNEFMYAMIIWYYSWY